MSDPSMVPFYYIRFLKALPSQSLVRFEAEVLSVSLPAWFYYEAISKSGCLDVPS